MQTYASIYLLKVCYMCVIHVGLVFCLRLTISVSNAAISASMTASLLLRLVLAAAISTVNAAISAYNSAQRFWDATSSSYNTVCILFN